MLAGVARKMAGQMFTALDADIAGKRPAAVPAAVGAPAGGVVPAEVGGQPTGVYAGSVAPSGGGPGFMAGALFGAGVALAGVVVGWWIGGH